MPVRTKHKRKKLARVLIEYGLHIWLLIFISNVVVFYAFRFFLMASTGTTTSNTSTFPTEPVASISALPIDTPTDTPTPTPGIPTSTPRPSPTPTPLGPKITLSFSLPGISSVGGNLKPKHTKRDVYIYVYSPDVNTSDIKVKPLFTVRTYAIYDDNPDSPTYTSFVNDNIDLGKDIIDSTYYQLAFKTSQTLMQLVKDPGSSSVGGKILRLARNNPVDLPPQQMIIGDIYPAPYSDNNMDINDYNMFVNCYGNKASSSRCISGFLADLDDNGTVDGTDYNLMLLSFQILKEKGYPIPNISNSSKIIINPFVTNPLANVTLPVANQEKPTPSLTPPVTQAPKTTKGGGGIGVIFNFIGFLVFIGLIIFAAFKFHLLDKYLKKGIKPDASPQTPAAEINPPETPSETLAFPQNTETENTQPATPETPGASASTPPDDLPPANPVSTPPAQTPQIPAAPVEQDDKPAPPAADVLEKSGFLKKVSVDTEKNGTWVTLADDSGITRGFYKGTNITDGFSKIKGTMKTDAENKQYIEITELTPEE